MERAGERGRRPLNPQRRCATLVLTAKRDERVIIWSETGPPVIVTLLDIDRNKIRVGFEAPQAVKIMREAILDDEQRRELREKGAYL